MEYSIYSLPQPSYSTPDNQSNPIVNETRPRKHTTTRPDSAIALLSDIEDDDDVEQEETFDRISGILESLIQEANEAVKGIEQERVHFIKKPSVLTKRSSKTPKTTHHLLNKQNSEPRRTRKRSSHTPMTAHSALKKPLFRQSGSRPRSCSTLLPQRPRQQQRHKCLQDSIKESFERLDSSIALVDSISRDLASSTTHGNKDLTALIFILLLNIPFTAIIFHFYTSTKTFYIFLVCFWICLFVLTHLIVDHASLESITKHASLPGSFTMKQAQFQTNTLKRRNSV
ncbi:unnamed protein product [Rhizopus stolonifer]